LARARSVFALQGKRIENRARRSRKNHRRRFSSARRDRQAKPQNPILHQRQNFSRDDARIRTGRAKYRRKFYDYNYAQGTLVPFRTVLYAGDKQIEETQTLTITFGQKIEDNMFQAG
jgi:hypothetical protein